MKSKIWQFYIYILLINFAGIESHLQSAAFMLTMLSSVYFTRNLFLKEFARFFGKEKMLEKVSAIAEVDAQNIKSDFRFIAKKTYENFYKIRKIHNETLPTDLAQAGVLIISRPSTNNNNRGKKTGKRKSNSDDGGDGDGDGDGEPPRREQQFLSYQSLASRWDCSVKTLQNQFSAGNLGLIPYYFPGVRGPRFSLQDVVKQENNSANPPAVKVTAKTKLKRGRPRITDQKMRGGAI